MPQTAPADASPTGSPRALRCRRPAGSGHRAVAGELAALAFELPAAELRAAGLPGAADPAVTEESASGPGSPVPQPRRAAD
ncbi:hypothetical protein SAMN05216207_1001140 [Pseudonocardia ammonioxydans]|uniref:Uncharacterized protein n=1 Tax=Pseudonocardia ammonioxydans TaxID=260086 RepID=A0A1I4RZG5_PSUAM|nr:hypothetical protein [Pseudonocardia ammonioxydans]SFM57380.1 hypothetical protein SAMN05216207_1001140 [Pseudonocardia ammonioxydans]